MVGTKGVPQVFVFGKLFSILSELASKAWIYSEIHRCKKYEGIHAVMFYGKFYI